LQTTPIPVTIKKRHYQRKEGADMTTATLEYKEVNGYRIPSLESNERPTPLGKWAHMRERYLKEMKPLAYRLMKTQGTLTQHLTQTESAAKEMAESLTRQMAASEGVNETLKATDQMGWVGKMNSIRNRAEEQVRAELIYS
jgi:hypothetical protein